MYRSIFMYPDFIFSFLYLCISVTSKNMDYLFPPIGAPGVLDLPVVFAYIWTFSQKYP